MAEKCMNAIPLDPITTSVVEHALASVTDEMATVLISTAYSPLVRDLLDFTVALCNPRGEMVLQGLGMPPMRSICKASTRSTEWSRRSDHRTTCR